MYLAKPTLTVFVILDSVIAIISTETFNVFKILSNFEIFFGRLQIFKCYTDKSELIFVFNNILDVSNDTYFHSETAACEPDSSEIMVSMLMQQKLIIPKYYIFSS